ncbi:MAG: pilus assembly protein PilM [Patescibacteria group bacterium]
MGLFANHEHYLGVDISSANIKVVELMNERGRARLITYGFVEQSTDLVKANSEEMKKQVISLLEAVLEKAKTATKKTVAALPNYSVFSSIMSLPQMSQKDLAQAVQWEAKKIVPLPIDEMIIDWKVLPEGSKPPSPPPPLLSPSAPKDPAPREGNASAQMKIEEKQVNVRILLTAAPKNLVERYVALFKAVGLELTGLETESFALERSLVGNDPNPIMIVDIGALTSNIIVAEKGIPLLNRSVDVGGNSITKMIAGSLGVDTLRAEQFKRDIGFTSQGDGGILKTIESSINPIINELKYCFDLYRSQEGIGHVSKIILTGGSAFLPGLSDYLSRLLSIKVFVGDPWARVIYPTELRPALEELGPRFSVAIGLAMREIS